MKRSHPIARTSPLRRLLAWFGSAAEPRNAVVEELEPRILYSADLNPALWAGDATAIVADLHGVDSAAPLTTANQQQVQRHEIVFVDAAVPDAQKLIDGVLAARPPGTDVEVVQIGADADGLQQITDVLAGERGIDAIHIISHGSAGQLQLGSGIVDAKALNAGADAFSAWRAALSADADLMLYGCDVAAGAQGQAFVQALALATGADVAASDDLTGAAARGGDWTLEFAVGHIETRSAVSGSTQTEWGNVLAIGVDSTTSGQTATNSITLSHTTSGTNRLMLVGVSMHSNNGAISSMTYNGTALTRVGTQVANGQAVVEVWSLVAPATGTHDLAVTFTGSRAAIVGVMTFTGVDQSTPLGSFASALGDSSTAALNGIASAAGELVFGVVDHHKGASLAPGVGQTEYWDLAGDNANGGGTLETGAASVDLSWGLDQSEKWTVGAVSIKPVLNVAPVLDATKSPALTAINEDAGAPVGAVGTLVSSLVDFASPSGQVDNVTDADAGASLGIAVTAADTANGSWYYSTNNGANWNALGAVTNSNARLLAADAGTRLYFQPNANYNGTLASAITFRAWDQTGGSNGALVSTATNGGSSAFSAATDAASLTVNAVNDAPAVANLGGDTLVYSTGAGAVSIEQGSDASVVDDDSANFDTGTLTVSFVAGSDSAEDVLAIRHEGSGAGQIGVGGSSVSYGGTLIGTFAGGSGGASLIVTLNSNATPAAAQALLRNVTYQNTDTVAPTTGARTVRFVLTDGDGGTSVNQDAFVAIGGGMAIWTNNTSSPQHAQWDGSAFGTATAPNALGEWTHIQAAEAPTRTEIIAVGVDANGVMRGELWNGSTWTAFSFNTIVDLGTTGYQSFQIAYEQQSGDAMLVWDNGTTGSSSLSYRTWNGTAWSAAQTITTPVSGEAVQMRLAADPNSDSMILAVTGTPLANDYALVWNGSSWGNSVTLDTATGIDGTEIQVAYEAHSGQALVVYDADGTTNAVNYRTWDGTSWSGQQSLSAPAGVAAGSDASFTVLVSDPNSNRIALGVVAEPEIWLAVWDGSAWTSPLTATASAGSTTDLNVALGFEHDSGDLLAAYGKNGSNYVAYRTWTSGGGWSAETASNANLNLGATPEALALFADPNSNQLMLGTRDSGNDVRYALWTGSAWSTALADSTGDAGGAYAMPMAFVWYDNNRTPVIGTTGLSMAENGTLAGSVASSDADGDARSYSIVGGADQAKFTIDSGTGALSFVSAPDYESPTDAGANNVYDVIVQVADGKGGTDSEAIAVTVTNANDAPVATNLSAAETYTEDTALNLTDIVISDVDSASVTATLTLSNTAAGSLNTGTSGAVTSTYNSGTGIWTASGAIADVNALLAGLTFTPTANFNSNFTIATSVSDGVAAPVTSSKAMTGTAVNDAPVVSTTGSTLAYTENGAATAVDAALTLSDVDNANLSSATVTISAGFASTEDTLAFTDQNGISGSWNAGTGVLTLTGSATVANYQTALRSITYINSSDNPSTTTRTVSFVVNDGAANSNTGTRSISITAVNDAPVITSNGGGASASISVAENTTAVTTLTSSDVDGGAPVYSILAGGDGAKFSVNASTGVLAFVTAPDHENPNDLGADNVYNLTLQVSDGSGGIDTQAIAVTVTDIADGIRVTPISVAPIGGETRVNTNTGDIQTINPNVAQAIATDAAGNFVVVWSSNLQDGDSYGIYAQRYSADGTAQGTEFRVNTTTVDNQNTAVVAMDAAGNFVVSWASNLQDGNGYGISAQRYNAAGVAQGSEFLVNSTTALSQTTPSIAMSASGAFVITWTGGGQDPDASSGIYAQRYDASGVAQGGEFRVNTYTTNTQQLTSVGMDAVGNFVVIWASLNQDDGASYGVYGQRYNAAGVAQGAEFRVNTTIADSQLYHDVAMLADGRFAVVFQSRGAGPSYEVYVQRYAADGSALGGETRVNTTTVTTYQPIPSISADASGNLTVVWRSPADGSGDGVIGRRLDWSGNALGAEFQVNTTTAGDQGYPEVVSQPGGGFIVAWSGNGPGDAAGVFFQRYGLTTTEAGGAATFSVVLEAAPTGDVVIPISVPDATEGSVVVGSLTFTTANWNIAQIVTVTGVQDYTNDGNTLYTVALGTATSSDPNFNGLNPADISVTNLEVPNVAPVNAVPGNQSTDEDTVLVFSTANGNAISISDADAGSGVVNVLLAATNGTITLNGTAGLSFISGDGSGDALLNFTGTIAGINAALNGLAFAPTAGYSGAASLQIVTGDMGNSGTGGSLADSDTVNITVNPVNDAPSASNLSAGETYTEDTALNLTDIVVSDVDSANVTATLTLSNTAAGSLNTGTSGAVTSTYNAGTGVWTASGAIADVNTLLAALTFTPVANFNSNFTFATSVSDGIAAPVTGSKAMTGTPVNDAPSATNLSAAEAYAEDTALNLTNIVVSDVDSANVTATLTLSNTAAGSLNTGTSGAVTSTYNAGTGVWTASGAIADVNTLLAGLTFTPTSNFNSNFTIATSVSDGVAAPVTGSKAMTGTAVNDAPSATNLSAAETYTEDTALNLTDIVISDVDSASVTATLTLSNTAAGSLNTGTSGAVTSNYNAGTGVWTASGAIADVNALLTGLTFTPAANFNSNFTLATSVSDGVSAPVTGSKAMTGTAVNDPPSATNLSAAETYTEDTALNLTDIVVSDVDSANVTATLTLSNTAAGSLNTGTSGAVTSTYNAGTGVWNASGALADVNALLAGLTFTPASNFNSNFTIATSVSDGIAAPVTGSKAMTGTAVNDAPSATNLNAAETYTEDTPLNLTDIVISDVDSASVTATLALSNTAAGSLSTGTSGAVTSTYNAGTGVWTAAGALADVNALLAGLTFTPAANFSSNFTIATSVSDGVSAPVTGSKAMTGTAVNDAPTATNLSAAETYTEDTALNLTDIVISDVDSANVTATLALSNTAAGSLSTGTSGAVTSTYNAGTGVWTASGAIADVNTLLAGLTFTPTANFNSNFTIATSISDGVAAPITGTKAMTGTAVNDAPSASNLGAAETYTEDTTLNLTDIVISDIDSANVTATLTLSNTAAGSLNTGTSGAVTSTYNAGTGVWSGSGALADVNALLAGLTFTPASNFNSNFAIATSISDGVAAPVTGSKAMTGTAVNDAPSATNLSAAETYTEDTALNLTDIVISDVDSANVTATLALSNTAAGSLSTGTSGAVTSTYNAGTGVWTAAGALADVNALLAGLTFTPAANFSSNFTIATSVSDGVSAPVTGSKAMTGTAVNDAPTATNLSAAETYTEDTALNLTDIVISDVDSASVTATLTLSNTAAGSLNTGTSGAVTSNYNAGTGVWTASGAIADVNALLTGLTFTPAANFNSNFTLATSVSDGVSAPVTGSKAMTGTAVNDPPSATNLSAAETYTEDTALNLTDIVVSDVDSANVTATLTLSNTAAGSLNTGTSGAVTSTYNAGTGVWSASGALADVNALLAGLTFTPASNFNSNFAIATSISDGIAAPVTGSKAMTGTAVNDAPSASNLGAAETYTEDTTLNLTDIVISDIDSANVTATLTLSNTAAGSLNTGTSGAVTSTYNAGTGVWSGSGALADVNALLAGLTFTPASNFNSNFAIATSISDGVAAPVTGSKAMTGTAVNDAPSATNLSAAETYTEDTALNLTDIVISDIDSANVTATLTLSSAAAGSLNTGTSGAVTSTYNAGTGVWTASGAIADVNTLLAGLTFTPSADINSNFAIATSVSDGVAPALTGTKAMTGTAVNDAPSATNLSAAETYTEDTALNLTDIVISDVDSASVTATLTLSNTAAGSLNTGTSGAVTSTYNAGTGVWTASGVVADVNALLAGLTFTPATNFNSNFTIATSVSDGVAAAVTGTKAIAGTAVADTPSVTSATTNEDTQTTTGLVITRNAADGAEVTHFQITGITNGTLYQNDGTTVIANGDFVTAAQGGAGLKFTPTLNSIANGSFTVQASTSNVVGGLGGSTVNATVTVNAVADTPSITPATTNEDTQTTSGLVISRNAADGAEVTHFQITGITDGTLYQNDGTTVIANGDFITAAQGGAGLKFTPTLNSIANGGFTIQASTSNGVGGLGGSTVNATITVNAVNDPAVLSSDIRNLTETNAAVDISSSGNLTISDVDSPATFVAQAGTVGTYGSFSIDAAGDWTYTASSAHDEFQAGVTYTDTFNVTSADSTTTTVTINILGTNDAAVLSADVANVTETNAAVDISSGGTLTIVDVDSAPTFVAQTGAAGTYGSFSVDAAGAWTYTASSAHDEFVAGVTYTDTFNVASADGTLTAVTINILGTNDSAVLSADTRNLAEGNLAADISTSGNLTISDVDSAATFTTQSGTAGSYGSFSVDAAGAWTYTASSAHDEFVAGVTYTDTFNVASADGTLTAVTINILGTNDAAVLSADVANLTEGNLAADISTSGNLTISDVDSSATFTAQAGTAGTYGSFSIDGVGAWTYTASSAHDEFVAGVTYIDTFNVTSADGTPTTVTINILGTNDAAVLSADTRNLTEGNTAAAISSSGMLAISDVDGPATFVAQAGTAGTYGSFSIDAAGAWTYFASSAHDEFVAGVTYTDTFNVTSADSTTTTVTINILGTNDAAVLSADVANLVETNLAADISSSGTLTIGEVDSPTTFVAQAGTAGSYGSFAIDAAGAWTYTASSAHNEFQAGVIYTDTFNITSADGTITTVTVNILGTNDAAVLSADTRNLTETNAAVDISSSGTLNIGDIDSPATFVAQAGTAGTYGSFSVDAAGAWTYTASSAHNEFQTGVTYTDTFTVTSTDGTPTTVTINLLGTNDTPVITSNGGGASANIAAAENQTLVTTVTSTDVDGGTPLYSIAGGADAALFSIDSATGVLSFNTAPDFEAPADAGADNVYDVTVQVADGNGGLSTQALAITLTGVNEAPAIAGVAGGTVSAGASAGTLVATVSATDPDSGAVLSFDLLADAGGRFAIDPSSGRIRVADASLLGASAGTQLLITVRVSDASGASDQRDLILSVQAPPDETPAFVVPAAPAPEPPAEESQSQSQPAAAPSAQAGPGTRERAAWRQGDPSRAEGDALPGFDEVRASNAAPRYGRDGRDEGAAVGGVSFNLLSPAELALQLASAAESSLLGSIDALLRNSFGFARGQSIESEAVEQLGSSEEQRPTALVDVISDPMRISSVSFTAGFVWWLTRGGGLLATMLMSLPAWRHIDLLPVLARPLDDEDNDKDDDFNLLPLDTSHGGLDDMTLDDDRLAAGESQLDTVRTEFEDSALGEMFEGGETVQDKHARS